MSLSEVSLAIKSLLGKLATDDAKRVVEELGAETLNIVSTEIWTHKPSSQPATAMAAGDVELRTLYVLTENPTVPNQQAWGANMTPGDPSSALLTDWIPKDKFGSNYTVRIFDGNDVEIPLGDQIANGMIWNDKTGVLTVNNPAQFGKPFKITHHRYIGPKGLATGGPTARLATTEPFSVPVDYEDANAIDPPAGTVFTSQDDVDDVLSDAGVSNYKHLQAVWNALPFLILHQIDINCAAGLHRPRATDTGNAAWHLGDRIFKIDGKVFINGAADYPPHRGLKGLVIQSYDAAHAGGSGDPQMTFSDTPFAGFDLKGRFVVIDTGQIALIHDHTDSVLYTCNELDPDPVDGSTTVKVADSPGTIFRNSLTDEPKSEHKSDAFSMDGVIALRDVSIDPYFGGRFYNQTALAVRNTNARASSQNVVVDHAAYHELTDQPAKGQNYLVAGGPNTHFSCPNLSLRGAKRAFNELNFAVQIMGRARVVAYGGATAAYVRGPRLGFFLHSGGVWAFPNCVMDEMGNAKTGSAFDKGLISVVGAGSGFYMSFFQEGSGKQPEIRNFESPKSPHAELQACVLYDQGAESFSGNTQTWKFTNNIPSAIRIGSRSTVRYYETPLWAGPPVFLDGGDNQGYGIIVEGPYAILGIGTNTNVTGKKGDLWIDGAAESYDSLPTLDAGPRFTPRLNTLSRG